MTPVISALGAPCGNDHVAAGRSTDGVALGVAAKAQGLDIGGAEAVVEPSSLAKPEEEASPSKATATASKTATSPDPQATTDAPRTAARAEAAPRSAYGLTLRSPSADLRAGALSLPDPLPRRPTFQPAKPAQ